MQNHHSVTCLFYLCLNLRRYRMYRYRLSTAKQVLLEYTSSDTPISDRLATAINYEVSSTLASDIIVQDSGVMRLEATLSPTTNPTFPISDANSCMIVQ